MAGHLRKWLYVTTLPVLLSVLEIHAQTSNSPGITPQAGSLPTSQSPTQAQDQPSPKNSLDQDQGSSNQPQAQKQDAGLEDSDKQPGKKTRFRLGTVSVGASYVHFPDNVFAGPAFWSYSFYPYSFYPYSFGYAPSYWNDPWFYTPSATGVAYELGKGEVKLAAEPKTAAVYLNGAYAGTAGSLKSMWLEPGAYDLDVSAPGRKEFHQRIYVLSGKSLKIAARLDVPTENKPPERLQEKSPEKREYKQ